MSVNNGRIRPATDAEARAHNPDGGAGYGERYSGPIALEALVRDYPCLRPPVIDGLLRRGETANIIAPPKVGKSWLTYSLALSVATGGDWLEAFPCDRGRVLIIDNELHPETLANRIPTVAEAMGLATRDYRDRLDVLPLRGRLRDLYAIGRILEDIDPDDYQLVVLDAWYRALPAGVSEADNAQVTAMYNVLDGIADRLDCAWCNIHHASKGSQANKDTTDVGSGAGSQSRAADAHLILRPHEVEGCAVLDAAVRSWAPVSPVVFRWEFPLWRRVEGLDPAELKNRGTRQEQRQRESDQAGMAAIVDVLREGPATESVIRSKAGMGRERCKRLLAMLCIEESVTWQATEVSGNPCQEYRLRE